MRDQKPTAEGPDEPSPGIVGRLRAAFGVKTSAVSNRINGLLPNWSRRTKIAVAIAGTLILVHAIVLSLWLPRFLKAEAQRRTTVAAAFTALDRNALMEAQRLANILSDSPLVPTKERGGPPMILGAVAIAKAQTQDETDRLPTYRQAANDLQDARVRGFPPGREAQGWFLLGQALYLAGDPVAARTPLEEAIASQPPFSAEAYRLLADAYFHGPDAEPARAKQAIDRYLSDSSLATDDRSAGLLLDAQILESSGEAAASQAILAQIPASSPSFPAALVVEAERLMREARLLAQTAARNPVDADAAKAKYQEAIAKLMQAERQGNASRQIARKAMFLIGQCWMESGNTAAALTQFDRVRVSHPQSEEAVAAAFQSADLLRRQGNNEAAIAMYRQVVRAIGDPLAYRNEYLSLDGVRKRLLDAYGQFLRTSQFDEATQLARLLRPLFPRERELELTGELLRSAANSYLAKAASAPPEQAKLLAAKARASLRRAALAMTKLAQMHQTSRTYTDDLWNAAESASGGQDYRQAATLLELYLKNELRRRRASALAMLGEAQLANGEPDKASVTLGQCIAGYPNDPACYQARILAAKAWIEQGDNAKAETLLQANLDDSNLTPRSAEWRDSLFALGSLLEASGRNSEAIQRLNEAVARYPDSPQATEARYLIAQACQHLGQQAQQKLPADTIETLRATHESQMRDYLSAAIERYEQLQTMLAERVEQGSADLNDQAILRNSRFALGASLFDLGRYEDAIRVYLKCSSAYRNEPEVLNAFVQLAACYRRLNRADDAQAAVAQAKAALARIKPDADFAMTTNYSRQEWGQVLDRLATL